MVDLIVVGTAAATKPVVGARQRLRHHTTQGSTRLGDEAAASRLDLQEEQ